MGADDIHRRLQEAEEAYEEKRPTILANADLSLDAPSGLA